MTGHSIPLLVVTSKLVNQLAGGPTHSIILSFQRQLRTHSTLSVVENAEIKNFLLFSPGPDCFLFLQTKMTIPIYNSVYRQSPQMVPMWKETALYD